MRHPATNYRIARLRERDRKQQELQDIPDTLLQVVVGITALAVGVGF